MFLATFLLACAYQQAMNRGEKLEAAGDWPAAYEAYVEAAEHKPDDPEAVAARTRAKDAVVEQELTEARIALDTGAFEDCKTHLDAVTALEPDHPEVFELTIDLEKTMGARYDYHWSAGDPRSAYDVAVRARKLLPKAVFLTAAFDQLRSHYTEEAEKLLKAKEHEKALAALKTITEFEPDRQSEVAPTEQRIRSAWADTLSARASTLSRSGKIGAAAVLYVRAYEVAGRAADLEASKPLTAKLRDQGKMPIQLDVEGAPARVGPVRDTIVAGLAGVSDTVVVRSAPSLTMRVTLKTQKCTETDAVTPTTLDYVSGQVEKPNPVHVELTGLLERAKTDEQVARDRSTELLPDVQASETAVKAFDDKLAAAQKVRETAKTALDAANAQLAATRKTRDDLDAQLDAQISAGAGTAATESLSAQVADATKRIGEWADVVAKHEAEESAAEQTIKGIEAQRTPAVEARDRLKAGYDSLIKDRDAAKQLVTELSAKLATTPKTVWEDVHELLKYDIHDWTRTCEAPASASARPTWKTTQPTTASFTPTRTTTDRSHIGHVKAKLDEDPKAYPESDTALVASADSETSKAVIAMLSSLTEDGYRARVDAAIDQMGLDPIGAATPIVALWLGARDRVDPTVQGVFTAHLKKEFGLERAELLGN